MKPLWALRFLGGCQKQEDEYYEQLIPVRIVQLGDRLQTQH